LTINKANQHSLFSGSGNQQIEYRVNVHLLDFLSQQQPAAASSSQQENFHKNAVNPYQRFMLPVPDQQGHFTRSRRA
jgi:hypothetical protein